MKKIICIFMVAWLVCFQTAPVAYASSSLPDNQQRVADEIARIAIEHYKEYGVLPSVAIAQAFIESTLGEHPSNENNYYGICSGAVSYSSFEEGIIGYLKVINNGHYDSALFVTDYSTQIRRILDGGYCEPEGSYYSDACWSIEHYGWRRYDEKLFAQLEKERKAEQRRKHIAWKKKQWSKTWTLKYDGSLKENEVRMPANVIDSKESVVIITLDKENYGIYDVKQSKKAEKLTIYINDKSVKNKSVSIKVHENVG